jgi:peptidoglycan/LPS O-acetylase OafA/YrhL
VNADWAYKLDYPLWSVATEWQIYFTFPLLLIGFRRMGVYLTSLFAMAIGWTIVVLTRHSMASLVASPWYLGFFALGATCAIVKIQWRLPRIFVAIFVIFLFWFGVNFISSIQINFMVALFLQENCIGLGAVLMIWYLCRWPTGWAARFLQASPIRFLGRVSYSLYVIHAPVLAICFLTALHLGLDPAITLLLMLTVSVAICIAVAYGLFKAVERPFMSSTSRARRDAVPQAAAS